jgi:hypothetical protein
MNNEHQPIHDTYGYKTKGDDYLKIWDSWGMTKEEWNALPVNKSKE